MKKTLFICTLLICSCSLFRKTNKTENVAMQNSKNQLDFKQLVLKSSGKETQVFTYRNDSGFYQYRHIIEQVNKAEANQLTELAEHEEKQSVTAKNTMSVQVWGIFGLAVLIIAFGLFYKGLKL